MGTDVGARNTGCSAAQIIPEIYKDAKSVTQVARSRQTFFKRIAVPDRPFLRFLMHYVPGVRVASESFSVTTYHLYAVLRARGETSLTERRFLLELETGRPDPARAYVPDHRICLESQRHQKGCQGSRPVREGAPRAVSHRFQRSSCKRRNPDGTPSVPHSMQETTPNKYWEFLGADFDVGAKVNKSSRGDSGEWGLTDA